MRTRLLLGLAAALAVAACNDSSTAPRQIQAGARSADDILECRSGYHIATRDDGTTYCAPDDGAAAMSSPRSPGGPLGLPLLPDTASVP